MEIKYDYSLPWHRFQVDTGDIPGEQEWCDHAIPNSSWHVAVMRSVVKARAYHDWLLDQGHTVVGDLGPLFGMVDGEGDDSE